MNSSNRPRPFQLYLLLTALALAAFVISLDGFIVNVAIPTIAGELGVRNDVGTWIITLFSISSTAFVPLSGFLSLRYGNYPLFMIGIALFAFASLIAITAPSFQILMVSRVLQGSAAGLLTPVTLALIISNFPEEKRSVGIGFWNFFVMVGPAMGPMIGGWLSDYRWHWMFFINIPICFFSAFTTWIFLKGSREKRQSIPVDVVGIVLLFLCVGTLQSALNRWNIDDWFGSPFIISLFTISALSFVFFIPWEWFGRAPLLYLDLFKNRNFTLPALTTGVGMALLFSSFVLDSLWVQEVLGYTPAWAGLTLAPVGFFPLIIYPLIGRFVSILDLRIWVIGSFILYACTFFWLSQITVYTPFWKLALPRLVQGIGFASFTVPNSVLVVRGVPNERLASVISLFSFTRMLFVGFGISLAITLWFFRETFYQTRLTSKAYPSNPHFSNLLAPFETVVNTGKESTALVYQTIQAEASTLALADIYYLFAWIFIALCFVVLFYKVSNNTKTEK